LPNSWSFDNGELLKHFDNYYSDIVSVHRYQRQGLLFCKNMIYPE